MWSLGITIIELADSVPPNAGVQGEVRHDDLATTKWIIWLECVTTSLLGQHLEADPATEATNSEEPEGILS